MRLGAALQGNRQTALEVRAHLEVLQGLLFQGELAALDLGFLDIVLHQSLLLVDSGPTIGCHVSVGRHDRAGSSPPRGTFFVISITPRSDAPNAVFGVLMRTRPRAGAARCGPRAEHGRARSRSDAGHPPTGTRSHRQPRYCRSPEGGPRDRMER